jgi:hypothetical protein
VAIVLAGVLAGEARAGAPADLVIANVTVIDGTDGPARPDQTVLIRAGKIAAIGSAVRVPPRARVIDGRGKYLIPGLWDMHAHVTHEEFREHFLDRGVTGVRHLYSLNPLFSPRSWVRGKRPAPHLAAVEVMLDGPRPVFSLPASWNVFPCRTEADARKAVARIQARGEKWVKVYSLLPAEAYAGAADEARRRKMPLVGHVPFTVSAWEAAEAGQRSIEHLYGVMISCSHREAELSTQMRQAIHNGKLTGNDTFHITRALEQAMDSHDPQRAQDLYRCFVRNRIWHVPTLVQKQAWGKLDDPAFTNRPRRELPAIVERGWRVERTRDGGVLLPGLDMRLGVAALARERRLFAHQLRLVGEMHRAGVRLLAGTDSPNPYCAPGASLHEELELLVKAGLSPLEALQTATRNAAEFLGELDRRGTISVGKEADLVLLDADPLEKIGNVRKVRAVVLGGRLVVERLAAPAGQGR